MPASAISAEKMNDIVVVGFRTNGASGKPIAEKNGARTCCSTCGPEFRTIHVYLTRSSVSSKYDSELTDRLTMPPVDHHSEAVSLFSSGLLYTMRSSTAERTKRSSCARCTSCTVLLSVTGKWAGTTGRHKVSLKAVLAGAFAVSAL